jgi:hypothetical protein
VRACVLCFATAVSKRRWGCYGKRDCGRCCSSNGRRDFHSQKHAHVIASATHPRTGRLSHALEGCETVSPARDSLLEADGGESKRKP